MHDRPVDRVVPRELGGIKDLQPLERRAQEPGALLDACIGQVWPEAVVVVHADLGGVHR